MKWVFHGWVWLFWLMDGDDAVKEMRGTGYGDFGAATAWFGLVWEIGDCEMEAEEARAYGLNGFVIG